MATKRSSRRPAKPRTEAWGDRTFAISDPDGYHLTFARAARGS